MYFSPFLFQNMLDRKELLADPRMLLQLAPSHLGKNVQLYGRIFPMKALHQVTYFLEYLKYLTVLHPNQVHECYTLMSEMHLNNPSHEQRLQLIYKLTTYQSFRKVNHRFLLSRSLLQRDLKSTSPLFPKNKDR